MESLSLYDDSTTLFADTWRVQMHELIGKGFAEARRRQGLTQEQAARRLQGRGLTAWRKSTVGQLEAGLRRPRLDEVLLMAAALQVPVDKLIPGEDDERVELGDGATVSPRWIREMLTGEFYRDTERPGRQVPYARFPVQEVMAQMTDRLQAEREYYRVRTAPIREHAKVDDHYIPGEDEHRMFDPPTDTERHAARRLGVPVPILKYAARTRWDHRDFDEERDSRVGNVDELPPRSRQARRGLVTREMLADLDAFLDRVGFDRKRDADGER
jgi:transcriptional regulator with XRE-family HTH domain